MSTPRRKVLAASAALVVFGGVAGGLVLTRNSPAARVITTGAVAPGPAPAAEQTATTQGLATETTVSTSTHDSTTTTLPQKATSSTTFRPAPTTAATKPPTPTTTTTTPAPTTTTTAVVCHDSLDPSCGGFRWDPQPANGPLTASLSVATPTPRAGEPVELNVVATDDSQISRGCYDGSFGDADLVCHSDPPWRAPRYGPWTPPAPATDRWEGVITHTYEQPGTYTVTLTFRSAEQDPTRNPYASTGTATVTFTVAPRSATGPPANPAPNRAS